MVRTQIQLTEEQAKKLRELSLLRHESIASLIRRAINRFLITGKHDLSALYRKADSVVGKFKTTHPDTSVKHDHYLDEDFRG